MKNELIRITALPLSLLILLSLLMLLSFTACTRSMPHEDPPEDKSDTEQQGGSQATNDVPQETQDVPQTTKPEDDMDNQDNSSVVNAQYRKITPEEAQNMMSNDSDLVILDVRTPAEFDEGHIRNAVLLPLSDIRDKAETILTDKDQTILVYCRSGRRSEIASRELIAMGYTNVYDFGGIIEWTGETVVTP